MLTSPTGCHAPQCIDLTGREYEARNFSPEGPLPRSLYAFVTSTVSPLSRKRSAAFTRKSAVLHSVSGTQKCDEADAGGNAKSGQEASPKARPTRRGSRGGRKHASALKKATWIIKWLHKVQRLKRSLSKYPGWASLRQTTVKQTGGILAQAMARG